MKIVDLLFLSVGLSIDTTVASMAQGAYARKKYLAQAFFLAFVFAVFQGFMPFLGWNLALKTLDYVQDFDHWISFVIFCFIGMKLIYEANQEDKIQKTLNWWKVLALGLAVSVDSLIAGASLNFMSSSITEPVIWISVVTFVSSLTGFCLAKVFKMVPTPIIEVIGGLLLIILGCKVLVSHLG